MCTKQPLRELIDLRNTAMLIASKNARSVLTGALPKTHACPKTVPVTAYAHAYLSTLPIFHSASRTLHSLRPVGPLVRRCQASLSYHVHGNEQNDHHHIFIIVCGIYVGELKQTRHG